MKLNDLLSLMQDTAKAVKASTPMICGGTPRDKVMGRLDNVSDLDITTGDKTIDKLSVEFAKILEDRFNISRKVMEDHSSIFIGNLKLDFSSNFNIPNIESHLNKIGIKNPTNMQKEIFSRDFTCNALLLSLDVSEITDITNKGLKDIKEKKIKTCLTPEITLTSNRNRVIRAIYLAAKLDFDIDDSIINYVKTNPNSVRIATEKSLTKKLNEAFEKDADKSAYYLTKMNLWKYVPITNIMVPFYKKTI